VTTNPSWRLKLQRAEEHLVDILQRIEPLRQAHRFEVTEYPEGGGGREYRLWTPLATDPYVAVMIGDFLFNVRSALDHLAVSLVPTNRQGQASFPILMIDPGADTANADADRTRRDYWGRATMGMQSAAVDVIRAVQPFRAEVPDGMKRFNLNPEDHVLAVLRAFQNADKHRRLVTAIEGLRPIRVTATNTASGEVQDITPDLADNHLGGNGATIHRGREEMSIDAIGAVAVAIGISESRTGPFRQIPDFPYELLRTVGRVADDLEALGES
jgi:hypothetical protein